MGAMQAGLFETLIGPTGWAALPGPVRRMHGNHRRVSAQGACSVRGDGNPGARLLRWLFGLPAPGSTAGMSFHLHRQATGERWTRCFASRTMHSSLRASSARPARLRESLGMSAMEFELRVVDQAIEWRLQRLSVLGVGLPARWIAGIDATSSARDGRYHFRTAARLPLVGLLVAYEGWLDHAE